MSNEAISAVDHARSATRDLWETLAAEPRLSAFLERARAGGLEPDLCGPRLYTVLAPVNEAFTVHGQGRECGREYLLRGAVTVDALRLSGAVKTLRGNSVPIEEIGNELYIGKARVVRADIECSNGVLHMIDALLYS